MFVQKFRDYKDKYKKLNARTKIGETFGLTPQEAESKYKNTRTGFGRYLGRVKSIPSGSGRNAVPVPKEPANLEWLSVCIEHKKTTSNLKRDPPDSDAGEIRSVTTKDTDDPLSDHSNDDSLELSEQRLLPADLDSGNRFSEAISPSTDSSGKPSNSAPET